MEHLSSPIPTHVLPSPTALSAARSAIHTTLSRTGLGPTATTQHISTDLTPGFHASGSSSRYFSAVTGGATPAAVAADHIASTHDQSAALYAPGESIAADIDHHALQMLAELLGLRPEEWGHKVFTTGATAANVVGLACGREAVVAEAGRRVGKEVSVAKMGLVRACIAAGKEGVQVLTSFPHCSLVKACSIVGLGHESVVHVGREEAPWRLDLEALEGYLKDEKVVSIIGVSCSEVQAGLFATSGEEMKALRALADKYGAWIHVDAAFGMLARILPDTKEFAALRAGVEGIELANSIGGDGHKLLNVPYDSGFLFSRSGPLATQVFHNPGAPYLTASSAAIPSPLSLGIENSRRLRALPVYANLVAYGRAGYVDMLQRQVRFARAVAAWMESQGGFEVLGTKGEGEVYMVVLFRAKDEKINAELKQRINTPRKIACSGTVWDGKPAMRLAVSNWKIDLERDLPVVKEVLAAALQ
ncbi:PLP-dependent transferase [Myriangium duriaei CBS 260.36]|uniref:PLP-dependent transferase n=1 Tax=Myriangium duriaei CBS 260.36 TaxID=1168546 RepID=A0A9P4J1U9_9PEZI|nr:PLP-dependent transferase [Myriangium duriaei CBS 260.36]